MHQELRPARRAYISALAVLLWLNASASAQVDYTRDILPILADKCYPCHGPDPKARQAGLRLDTREGAFRVRRGKAVLVPGNRAASELIHRITSTDPDVVMP